MSVGFIFLIIGIIGIVFSITLMICLHRYFRKKEKNILELIENE